MTATKINIGSKIAIGSMNPSKILIRICWWSG